MRPRRWLLQGLLSIAFIACNPAPSRDEHVEVSAPNGAPRTVEVRRAEDRTLFELPARVVADPRSRARLDVPYRASVVAVPARVGDRVQEGAPLAELSVPELLQAAAALRGISAQLEAYERRRERLSELRGRGLVQAGEVFEVESSVGRLSSEQALALSTLKAFRIDGKARRELLRKGTVMLTSPVDGVVTRIAVHPGSVAEAGVTIAEIAGVASARVEVTFTGALDPGIELQFITESLPPLPLRSEAISTVVEPQWGRTLAWFALQEDVPLPEGLRGKVLVHSTEETLLTVPVNALRLHEGQAWVGQQAEPGSPVVMVEVDVLRTLEGMALVRSASLKVGDRIVADPTDVLRMGVDADALGGGHHHGG